MAIMAIMAIGGEVHRDLQLSNLVAHLPKLMESFPKSSTELLYIAPRSPGFNVGSVIGRIPGSQ